MNFQQIAIEWNFQEIANKWRKLPRGERGVIDSEPKRRLFKELFEPGSRGWFKACQAWINGDASPDYYPEITELIDYLGERLEFKDRQIVAQTHLDCARLLLPSIPQINSFVRNTPSTQEMCRIVSESGLPLGFIRELLEELRTGQQRQSEGDSVHILFPLVIVGKDEAVLAEFIFEKIPNGLGDIYLVPEQGLISMDNDFKASVVNASTVVRSLFPDPVINSFDIRLRLKVLDEEASEEITLEGPSAGFALAIGAAKCFSNVLDSDFARKLAALNLEGVAFSAKIDNEEELHSIGRFIEKVIRLIFSRKAQAQGVYVFAVSSEQPDVPNMLVDKWYALLPAHEGVATLNAIRSAESLIVVRASSVSEFVERFYELQSRTILNLLGHPPLFKRLFILTEYLLTGARWFLPLLIMVLFICWYFFDSLRAIVIVGLSLATGIGYGLWKTKQKAADDNPPALPEKALYSRLDWASMALVAKAGQHSWFQKALVTWLALRLSKPYLSNHKTTLQDTPKLWRKYPWSWEDKKWLPRAWLHWFYHWTRLLFIIFLSAVLFSPLQYCLGELIPYGGEGDVVGGDVALSGGLRGNEQPHNSIVRESKPQMQEWELLTNVTLNAAIRLSIADKTHTRRQLRVSGDGFGGLKESDKVDNPSEVITIPVENGKATFQVILDQNNPLGVELTIETLSYCGTVLKKTKLKCGRVPDSQPSSLFQSTR